MSIVMSIIGFLFYVPLMLVMAWMDFILTPFDGFTFTDPLDFLFAGLIVLTLIALAVRHATRPYPARWLRFARAAVWVLTVVTPLVPLAALSLLAWKAQALLGHWPRPMLDDPKYIGLGDPAYQKLSGVCVYASAFAGWGLLSWGALLLPLWPRLTARRRAWLVGAFRLAWIVFLGEPGQRYAWWLD